MAREIVTVDVTHTPDLLRLAEEVATTRVPRVLRRDSEDIAVVVPVPPRPARIRAEPRLAEARQATLESTAASLEPAIRTEDIEAMIRDAKDERAERTMAKLRQP